MIGVTGKNMFPIENKTHTDAGFTIVSNADTGTITINGERDDTDSNPVSIIYTIKYANSNKVDTHIPMPSLWIYSNSINNSKIVGDSTDAGSVLTWYNIGRATSEGSNEYVMKATAHVINGKKDGYINVRPIREARVRIGANVNSIDNLVIRPQLEVGPVATEYEKPFGIQVLTVTSATELAGIPVPSGGNYTYGNGEQWVCDEIDFGAGTYTKRIGRIDNYNGEKIVGPYLSSTGQLSTGATVYYIMEGPIVSSLSETEKEQYHALHTHCPNSTIYNNIDAYMEVEYSVDTGKLIDGFKKTDIMVKPVEDVWEQRMLERIDQMMIPMAALRKLPKAASGYVPSGYITTGVNYSSLGTKDQGRRLVGTQVPLSAYYSAIENPASKMYTEDLYQESKSKSTYYGINCSGFVSYVCGFGEYIWTSKMADQYRGTDNVIPVSAENDLFNIRRGDILLNTIVGDGKNPHVMIVKDVVCDRYTGKILGFNIADSWKPFVRCRFLNMQQTLGLFSASNHYSLIRLDDADKEKWLNVIPVSYSKSVYPDNGDGGKYISNENVWLYIPDFNASSITYELNGTIETESLNKLESMYVNGVKVYKFVPPSIGTYKIYVDTALDDACSIIVYDPNADTGGDDIGDDGDTSDE